METDDVAILPRRPNCGREVAEAGTNHDDCSRECAESADVPFGLAYRIELRMQVAIRDGSGGVSGLRR
jgi:hypothetical protein